MRALLSAGLLALLTASCAPKLPSLPGGAGSPFPEYEAAYLQAVARCRGVQSLVAVLEISGRAAGQRLRASIDAGFEAPDLVRLELPAPGRPYFTFVATGSSSILILAREGRVLRNAPPADVLDALTGVRFGPQELREIITGCGFGARTPAGGRMFPGGRAAIETGDVVNYLALGDDKQWRVIAARGERWQVFYDAFVSGLPSAIRLVSTGDGRQRTDLRIRLSQVEVDQPIDRRAFLPEIPADATPITLDELRQAGPRGG